MEFEELSGFTKAVLRLLDDGSYSQLQYTLVERPDAGPIIAGSGGLRKIRWARSGGGKSGGVRVIYYWWVEGSGILLADIFPKNEKENLSAAELAALRKKLEEWKIEKDTR
jgi:hypothetical protein